MKKAWDIVMRMRTIVSAFVLGTALIAGCSGGGSSGGGTTVAAPTGTVTGQVASAVNNAPVAGATVSTTAGTTTSGLDGSFTVPAPANNRAVVHVEANGFAETFPVTRVVSGQTTTIGVKLLPVGVTTTVNVANGGTVTVLNSTAQVELPTNGLVPQNGGAAAGTVNVSVTPINPAVDPNLMPGDFTGVSAGGTTPIESFGAIVVDIRDNAGTRYNLAAGKTSIIRIPLGTLSPNPPATLPLWFFDEATGLWKEEGTATLTGNVPNQFYEGTVTHFSTWNADQPALRTWVSGCVRDVNGQPVANAWVQSQGVDYTGTDLRYTPTDGTFRVGVRKGGTATISVVEWSFSPFSLGAISNPVTVTSLATDPTDFVRSLSDCLVVRPGVLTITSLVLAGGNVNAVYSQTLAAVGGVPGYVWSLNAGSNPLPAGLALNPSGVISGTPTTAGTTTIIVKVTDSAAGTATKQLSLTINPAGVFPVTITSLSPLPAGTVGTAYTIPLSLTGGTPPLSWSVVSGSGTLPDGLRLNPSTGQISGTPTTAGTSTFTILVQDSGAVQQSDQKPFSLTVNLVSSGSGGGTLTVANAPLSVGGSFVVDPQFNQTSITTALALVIWAESPVVTPFHDEILSIGLDLVSGQIVVVFGMTEGAGFTFTNWQCAPSPGLPCAGVTFNRATGTASFTNTVLTDTTDSSPPPPITLNGTLTFTPF